MNIRGNLILFLLFGFLLLSTGSLAEPEMSSKYSTLVDGRKIPILKSYERWAKKLDRNRDKFLDLREFARGSEDFSSKLSIDLDDFAIGLRHQFTNTASQFAPFYPTLAELEQSFVELASKHPQQVELELLALSQEGRHLSLLKIRGAGSPEHSPKILLVAGLHAREWVTPQVAVEAAKRLLGSTTTLEGCEVWIVPLANPDGYHYSHQESPMWRKNRKPLEEAVGVDLNRNFPFDYRPQGDRPEESDDDVGGSDEPYSLQYRGPSALSEPESKAIAQLLDSQSWAGVLDLHSFGCKVLLPNEPSSVSRERYRQIGERMVASLQTPYEVMQYQDLYKISGHLAGYADSLGIPAVTLELGRSFQPHPDKLPQLVEESAEAVLVFIEAVLDGV